MRNPGGMEWRISNKSQSSNIILLNIFHTVLVDSQTHILKHSHTHTPYHRIVWYGDMIDSCQLWKRIRSIDAEPSTVQYKPPEIVEIFSVFIGRNSQICCLYNLWWPYACTYCCALHKHNMAARFFFVGIVYVSYNNHNNESMAYYSHLLWHITQIKHIFHDIGCAVPCKAADR